MISGGSICFTEVSEVSMFQSGTGITHFCFETLKLCNLET